MVKQFEHSNTYNFTWDQVAKAFWRRYPNPESIHVLSEDTICREMRGDLLYTKRLLTKTNSMPKWGQRFVKKTQVIIVEESIVHPKENIIITYTNNVGYTRIMSIEEQVVYTQNPENSKQTLAVRTALINSQIYGFRRAIEGFGLDRFRKNCIKAIMGFNFVLNMLYPGQTLEENSKIQISRFEETTGKIKEKAKRAGEIAKGKAESISSIYNASKNSNSPRQPS